MEEKTILITGATDGIGKQAAIDLAADGFEIIVHGRDSDRVEATLSEIRANNSDAKVHGYTADFQSLETVSNFADELRKSFPKIDVLFNNAAVFAHERTHSSNNLEINFQVNYLAHFLLTLKIHDLVQNSESGRIVNVSSMVHAAHIDLTNIQFENNYSGNAAFAASKLCNILFTNKLARLFEDTGIAYLSLHPGVIETKLLNSAFSGGFPVSEGSKSYQYVATAPELQSQSGVYIEMYRPMRSNTISYDTDIQDQLWDNSMDLVEKYL